MNRQEVLTEMTGAVGSVFLGLTVGCARCHNHKFDPILQSDYYRLQAIHRRHGFKEIEIATPEEKAAYEAAKKEYEARLEPIKKQIAEIEKPYRERLRREESRSSNRKLREAFEIPEDKRTRRAEDARQGCQAQIKPTWDEVVAIIPAAEKRTPRRSAAADARDRVDGAGAAARGVCGREHGEGAHRLHPESRRSEAEDGAVDPGLPWCWPDAPTFPQTAAGRRAALANWLASPDHPLTARVMVNRIWQFRMGTGIVATPNDFGALGARPSNQKLLDWLATEFMAHDWSVKAIDRMIVPSQAYQDSGNGATPPGRRGDSR